MDHPEWLTTPALVVDPDILDANVARISQAAAGAGITLFPHAKTHKCAEIGARQGAAGAAGLSVATIGEAAAFARAGVTDLFLCYSLWLDPVRAEGLRAVAASARLRIGVDSVEGAGRAGSLLAGSGIEAMVEVDSGHHRCGVAPAAAGEVARAAAAAGLRPVGVFSFPGHSYAPGARHAAAEQEAAALAAAAASMTAAGQPARIVSGGSTPSLEYSLAAERSGITELRPGVYVFGDAQQWALGSCRPDQLALTAHATVISRRGRRVVVDSGSKILGADRPGYVSGFGRLLDHPEARIDLLSEHHAVIEWADEPLPELGAVLRVVPNHACNAVNLVDSLAVRDRGGWQRWTLIARGTH